MTDVEGSTRRWRDAPEAMNAAMRRHHEIIHGAVAEHGGWCPVDQGEGDSIFAAFPSAIAAVATALQVQRELQAEAWPEGADLRVRIGLHAGDVLSRDGNLYGDTVNRCARVRGVASGGQVVLSSSLFELVRDRLPEGASLLELGEHRLVDLTRPERLYQLCAPGLERDFPPLSSLDRAQHNLPIHPSTFVGREAELSEVVELLKTERLVTVTGFGGMGKTRFALQVAAELADGSGDGVWFVDLSSVTEPERVPAEVVAALGISETGQGPAEAVLKHLSDKRLLLLLDNLEQVMGAAGFVAEVHARCPDVVLLVTSREPLRLRAEHEFALAPLSVPSPTEQWTDHLDQLGTYEAVRLFVDRAVAASRHFTITNDTAPAVAAIVARLDGHPLAIELAAARLKTLNPQMLLARLDSALTLLTGGGRDHPVRHQTLNATIAWSYDLLTVPEQRLLDRLSVFDGAPTLEAIEAVCGSLDPQLDEPLDVLDGVTALVDKSLLRASDPELPGERRFSLLGSIRDFARKRLEDAGATTVLRDRHAEYFAALGQISAKWSPQAEDAAVRIVRENVAEFRAAFHHLARSGADAALLEFPWAFLEHMTREGLLSECLSTGHLILSRNPEPHPAKQVAFHQVAWSLEAAGQNNQALALRRQMLQEAEALGDGPDIAFALCGMLRHATGAAQLLELAARLNRRINALDPAAHVSDYADLMMHVHAALRFQLAFIDVAQALEHARAGLEVAIAAGSNHNVALHRAMYSRTLLLAGDLAAAQEQFDQVDLDVGGPLGRSRRPGILVLGGELALRRGEPDVARTLAEQALAAAEAINDHCEAAQVLLADLDHLQGRHDQVLERLLASLGQVSQEDPRTRGRLRWRAARACRLSGDPSRARELLDLAMAELGGVEAGVLPDLLAVRLEDALLRGDPEATERATEELRSRLPETAHPVGLLAPSRG